MFFKIYVILFAICLCDSADKSERIVGGTPLNDEIFPAAVSLLSDGKHICGGTRLNNFVLTAAHCIIDTPSEHLRVEQKLKGKIINLNIKKIVAHEFNRKTNENDIAIVIIEPEDADHAEFGFFPLSITLPKKGYKPKGLCFVPGPGIRNQLNVVESDIGRLYGAVMPVIPPWRCRNLLGFYLAPARNTGMFCAGSGVQDACQGDSGSALFCLDNKRPSWILAGLVSYGMGCGKFSLPGVFTDIAHHRAWIDGQLRAARP